MALVVKDRVQESTTTSGTGTLTLAGAVPGYQSFSSSIGNGNTTFYTIYDNTAQVWEVGIGTVGAGTLARTTVLSNSSGNTSPITLAGNPSSVFVSYPAEQSVSLNASDNVSPLGTISSGTWQGTTIGVAYGGTGVTTSSGANSVVLRDANQNINVNRVNQSNTNTTAAGGTTALTVASSYIHSLVGTGGQTYTLPDATTLTTGVAFIFNNLATGTLTIQDYATATIGTIPSGGAGAVFLTNNATVGGTWDLHAYLPEGVTFGTNLFNLGSAVITGGTWNGGTIGTAYGGTGLTSFSAANYALYSTSSSALTAGTLPIAAGGTAATTFTANGVLYGNGTSALGVTAEGTTGQVLVGNTGAAPTWGTLSSSAVTTFQTSLNGLTPSTATSGAVTLAGTLGISSGGTGQTTALAAFDALSPMTTLGDMIYEGTGPTATRLAIGSTNQVLTVIGGIPSWQTPVSGDVTSISFGSTGLTPSTATSGAVTVAGTLAVANGGTGVTTSTGTGATVLGTSPTFTTSIDSGATFGAFASSTALTIGSTATGASSTTNIATAALTGAFTKTVNIGTSGTTSSTTAINIGSATNGTTTVRGALLVGAATTSTTDGAIFATNNVTAYAASDKQFKENIREIPNALEKVEMIGGKLFEWSDKYIESMGGKHEYFMRKEDAGVIAQDVEKAIPELVRYRDDGSMAVDYPKLVALAFAAIKELSEKVKELENK